jgi:hypothetical protein
MATYEIEFDSSPMKKLVWHKVVRQFNKENNVAFDLQKIKNKWKSLKRTYKNIKKHNESTGREQKNWKYFSTMDDIMCKKPEISAPATCTTPVLC